MTENVSMERAGLESDILGHLNALRAFARTLHRNEADVDDLVQETVLKALAHLHQFSPGTNIKSWMLRS